MDSSTTKGSLSATRQRWRCLWREPQWSGSHPHLRGQERPLPARVAVEGWSQNKGIEIAPQTRRLGRLKLLDLRPCHRLARPAPSRNVLSSHRRGKSYCGLAQRPSIQRVCFGKRTQEVQVQVRRWRSGATVPRAGSFGSFCAAAHRDRPCWARAVTPSPQWQKEEVNCPTVVLWVPGVVLPPNFWFLAHRRSGDNIQTRQSHVVHLSCSIELYLISR